MRQSRGFLDRRCEPPTPRQPKSLATRRHPQCQTERWVVAASFKSARPGVSSTRVQTQAVQAPRVQEQGHLKLALTVQEELAQAQMLQELTEPTLQLSAAYLGADVSHGSMPVSTPNTSARREAQVSFQEPSDLTTEQRTANMMAAAWHDSANGREVRR